jgi:hypothetical protein
LEIVLRIQNNTASRSLSTGSDEETHEAENIFVSDAIRHRQMLAKFSDKTPEPFWMPVKGVYPCPTCRYPIATIRLGSETKIVDCVENQFAPFYWQRWECDVIGAHVCLLGGLQ